MVRERQEEKESKRRKIMRTRKYRMETKKRISFQMKKTYRSGVVVVVVVLRFGQDFKAVVLVKVGSCQCFLQMFFYGASIHVKIFVTTQKIFIKEGISLKLLF